MVLPLAAPEASAAADRLLLALEASLAARGDAEQALWDQLAASDTESRRAVNRALRSVRKGKLPADFTKEEPVAAALRAWRLSSEEVAARRQDFQERLEEERILVAEALREIAAFPLFREAVTWQNRRALRNSIDSLLQTPCSANNKETRKRERLVASYAQRYSVKNDTIGFFGPVGWVKLDPDGAPIEVKPGPGLVAARRVFFEGWCIDALADRFDQEALRPWLSPRRLPVAGLVGRVLHVAFSPAEELEEGDARLLRAADGTRTARSIARELLTGADVGFEDEAEVFSRLSEMAERGLIAWRLEVPLVLEPEGTLRRCLEGVEDEALRAPALAALDELEGAKNEVAAAAGNADALDEALGRLESSFQRITGVRPTRAEGQTYGSRGLVYEDCRRDLDLTLGPRLLEQIGAPLSLLLQGARWYIYEVSRRFRPVLAKIYDELAGELGTAEVPFLQLWIRLQPLLLPSSREATPFFRELVDELQRRWADLLRLNPAARRVQAVSADIQSRVEDVFGAPGAGWRLARYQPPDVLIAAPDVEAIRRGEHFFVLGELHAGANSLDMSVFVSQHPQPQDLFRALEADHPDPLVRGVIPKEWTGQRTNISLVSPKHFRAVIGPGPTGIPPDIAIGAGDVVVERRDDTLVARTLDGGRAFDLIEFLGHPLTIRSSLAFDPFGYRRHRPRITMDRLVVCREGWRFAPAELSFADEKAAEDRFLGARRWARAFDLPRFVFVKVPVETKPHYLDLESPVYVEIFSHLVRRSAEQSSDALSVSVTEMLPVHGQQWLPDAGGQRYTAELRLIGVDPMPACTKSFAP